MKTFIYLYFFLITITGSSQIIKKYESVNSDYFPVKLYILEDSKFLYREFMDKDHANSEYYEKGNYESRGDTLYLFADNIGFNCGSMVKELHTTIGLIKGKNIDLLTKNGKAYLKLKRVKFRNKKEIFDCLNFQINR